MKTINEIVEKFDVSRSSIYKGINEGVIPAEKKEKEGSNRKAYFINDDFLSKFDDGVELKDHLLGERVDRDKAITSHDLIDNLPFCATKIYSAFKNGTIPAEKKRVTGSAKKTWVVDKEFAKFHSYDDMKKLIDNRPRKSHNSSKEKDLTKNLFSAREIAENFGKSLQEIRKLLYVFGEKDFYNITSFNGVLYMHMEDVLNMEDDTIEDYLDKYVDNTLEQYLKSVESDKDYGWTLFVEYWAANYGDEKVRAGDLASIAKIKGLFLDIFDRNGNYSIKGELINFGREMSHRIDSEILGEEENVKYKIKGEVRKGTGNRYYLEKYISDKKVDMEDNTVIEEESNEVGDIDIMTEDENLKVSHHIYEVSIEKGKTYLKDRMFTFTACNGNWDKVGNELEKIVHFLKDKTDFSFDKLTDCRGNKKNDPYDNEKRYLYFSTLPDADYEDKFIFSAHNVSTDEKYTQYYISPYRLEWLEGKDNTKKYEISKMEYAISKFQEENPDMADSMEVIKGLLKDMRKN